MLLNSNIKQKNNDLSAKYRQGHLRVAGNLQGLYQGYFASNNAGTGRQMKSGSNKRNYLFAAFAAITMFTMALPGTALAAAAALACVNSGSCTGNGGFIQTGDGPPFCSGGGQGVDQHPVCSGSQSSGQPSSAPPKFSVPPTRLPMIFPGETASERELAAFYKTMFGDEPEIGNGRTSSGYLYLGMRVDGGPSGDATLSGGGYSLRNSGASISDTAGLIAPGTQSASFRENGGGGGINGTYDASRFVGPNQRLWFNGAFDYTSSSANFGGVGAGSTINSNNYSFTGTVLYSNYNTYLALSGSYQFGNNSEFNSSDGSTGSYGSDGYDIDARVGHIFWLLNTISQPTTSRMAVKAPPKPSDGYAIGLDLSGHLGFQSDVAKGFTDSSGFVFGDERVQGGETGLKAKLFATVQNNGLIWAPYVTGTVDWRFNYSHVANFPGQLALATGDAVTFADATTFVGAKVGLDVKTSYGWIVGVNGFYDHSTDTEIIGGKAYVMIPFGETAVSARY